MSIWRGTSIVRNKPRRLICTSTCSRNGSSDSKATSNNKDMKCSRQRPIVHLSSATGVKYRGKSIGSPFPVTPHEVTPRRVVDNPNVIQPHYALSGRPSLPNINDHHQKSSAVTIHDQESIQKMREAGHIARKVLNLACSMAKVPSITTDEIDAEVHHAIVWEHGAYPSTLNFNGFPKSLCTSVNEVICHGVPDMRPLEQGDVVSLDVSVFFNGVHGDNCATVIVGEDNDDEHDHIRIKKDNTSHLSQFLDDHDTERNNNGGESRIQRARLLVDATKEALNAAISSCYNGNCLSNVGRAVNQVADQYGLKPIKKWCGHGVGSELHMPPSVKHYRNHDKLELVPGMIFTIEPCLVEGHHAFAIWADGWTACTVDGGMAAQFEHTILITESGPPETLTSIT